MRVAGGGTLPTAAPSTKLRTRLDRRRARCVGIPKLTEKPRTNRRHARRRIDAVTLSRKHHHLASREGGGGTHSRCAPNPSIANCGTIADAIHTLPMTWPGRATTHHQPAIAADRVLTAPVVLTLDEAKDRLKNSAPGRRSARKNQLHVAARTGSSSELRRARRRNLDEARLWCFLLIRALG